MECLKSLTCKECGGEVENGACMYCGAKDFTINMISNLINSDDINSYYINKIRAKIAKGECLDKKEDKVFSLLLDNNLIKDEALDDGLIITYTIQGKKLTSYNTFRLLVMRSTERTMREINNGRIKPYNPHARTGKLDGANGSAFDIDNISFNELILKQLYEGYIYPLSTYFHELVHVAQNIEIRLGSRINFALITMLKESLIRRSELINDGTDNYYKKNYYNISFEVNAHQFGIEHMKQVFKIWGLKVDEEWFDKIRRLWPESNNNLDRIVTGEDGIESYKTVDDIFDYVIAKNPQYLKEYPQLNFEYVNENGTVRKRTKNELSDIIMNYMDNEEILAYLQKLINKRDEKQEKIKL